MDNLRSVLRIVLSKIPAKNILTGKIQYNDITKDTFVQLAGYYVKNYSNDELENMFCYMKNEYEEQADFLRGYAKKCYPDKDSFSIFDAILIFSAYVLEEGNGEPVCKYQQLLRWRMTSHELDEDVFTTAYLAYKDLCGNNFERGFSWRPVIRHNNVYLNRILAQGIVDNHFHLKGSAPQFPLSWISMMNDVENPRFREQIELYSKRRLSTIYYTGDADEALYVLYVKAAMIRCYLYAKLTGRPFILRENIYASIWTLQDEKETDEEKTEKLFYCLLRGNEEILDYRGELQENINNLKRITNNLPEGSEEILDYALNGKEIFEKDNVNYILSGERWLMYTMFRYIYAKSEKFKDYFNLFYAYLTIKGTMRSELVQTNSNIGFDNFALYQDRKEDFIDGTKFEKYYFRLAIKGTIQNQNLLSLEVRITPKDTGVKNRDYIRRFDGYLDREDEEIRNRFFYVFHFIKEKDMDETVDSDIHCRHTSKREKLRRQARAIADFRESFPKEAARLKGIDTCAKEIGCRPEVFAQTYRYLKRHKVYRNKGEGNPFQYENDMAIKQLGLTYHIGEDYLDIVDGLRSIEEAVRFLDLGCGSRMGHALALGVDVEAYYGMKNNKILINQQDYLDNLVWMYHRIRKFGLKGYDDLLLYIEQQYSRYFRIIYGNYICDAFFYSVLDEAKEHFASSDSSIVEGYCNSHFKFGISEYYEAWKLRGDNPECYIRGYFLELDDDSEWNRHAVAHEYPQKYNVRFNPECAYLYHLYHYNSDVKKEGAKVIEVDVSHVFVQCVKHLQLEMQKWISEVGIGIECNPSSNYLIGTFDRYDKHPIFKFYNAGLAISPEEIVNCPQIPVCVNTDDQGIFSTYLENEYALLALALEKMRDENGKRKYKRTMIYEWIDHVRKMGINLSFADIKKY